MNIMRLSKATLEPSDDRQTQTVPYTPPREVTPEEWWPAMDASQVARQLVQRRSRAAMHKPITHARRQQSKALRELLRRADAIGDSN